MSLLARSLPFLMFVIAIVGSPVVRAQTLEDELLAAPPERLAEEAMSQGDARRGAILFHQPHMACSKCHRIDPPDDLLAPDLTQQRPETTAADLVDSVLRPSKEIRKGYAAVSLVLQDGRSVSGLLVLPEAATRSQASLDERLLDDMIRLRDPATGRIATYVASEIDERALSPLSIMPAQQVNQLASRQQFLDLIAYLIALRDGGREIARELQPPAALTALSLPEYESRVDHAGLISDLDDGAFERGEAIYQRLCINCHGDHERPGSLPTALRFAEGRFKSGSDPFTMYQTLTRGFGFMVPQTWMVPQQKYDVIHYIREAYLRDANPSQYFALTPGYLAGLPEGDTRGPKPRKYEPWSDMNYGPHLVGTYEIPGAEPEEENFAYKGIAVRLDPGAGGVGHGNAWMIFDHDTMRMAAAWTASPDGPQRFIDWQGIHFDGRHNAHPTIVGEVHLSNPTGPGWADPETGSFADAERVVGRDGKRYGPLPRNWARFHGFYAHEHRTVVSYSIGNADILEMPGLARVHSPAVAAGPARPATDGPVEDEATVFTRAFDIGPRPHGLTLLVATHSQDSVQLTTSGDTAVLASENSADASGNGSGFDGRHFLELDNAEAFNMDVADFTITARLRTKRGGTVLARTELTDEWVPGGKVLFVRGGRLCYDTGWVGVVQSAKKVDDGRWHDVAVSRDSRGNVVRLYVDGERVAKRELAPGDRLNNAGLRVGFCTADFPGRQSYFAGDLRDVRFYSRELSVDEIAGGSLPSDELVAHWPLEPDQQEWGREVSGNNRHLNERVAGLPSRLQGPLVAGLSTPVPGSRWRAEGRRLLLDLPAGPESMRFVLWTASVAADIRLDPESVAIEDPVPDLSELTSGTRPRWPDRVTSNRIPFDEGGPFAVDELMRPTNNPWLARLRLTGLDFFEDPDRMVVTSWDGDVWLVTGLSDEAGQLTWQRIASGLFQPLGVKVVDGVIYVTCRDQLVILRDTNGDGETDFYQCFNNDHQVTEHFHEFAMGLQVDDEGNFYYAKSARHALPALVPHHGTLLRVSADGSQTDILANGFRAANGVCLNPDGTFIVTDQEGHWNPKNRINWVVPGEGDRTRFYGNMFGYHDVTDVSDEAMEPPLCWITNAFDRSPAELLWVDNPEWGQLDGSLLNFSYGYGKVYVVPHEEVGGIKQGGMCELPVEQFPTGTMRGRFSPHDGRLYTCGMFAWASSQQSQVGGLYCIQPTGRPTYVPIGLNARPGRMVITFSDPLDRAAATDPTRYAVKVWSLKRTQNYGSKHYDEHALPVTAAELGADGRTLVLLIPDLKPTWGMEIRCELVGAGGTEVERVIHNTIHRLEDR